MARHGGAVWTIALMVAVQGCTGFREVRSGVFRSPQPTEDALARTIERHGIRTVVLLRGRNEDTAGTERAAVGQDIAFVHVPMSATRLPAPETLLALWQVAETAPRPLLVHCRAGVDRTGLASALVVLHDTGDLDAAKAQLDFVPYGHVAAFGTQAMDEVLERYATWHGRRTFPDWVRDVYAAEFAAEQELARGASRH